MKCGLCIIDVQEKLFPHIHQDPLPAMLKLKRACELFEMPIIVSEQYPEGLGKTIPELRPETVQEQKTCFAASHWSSLPPKHWLLMGIETHVCVFQTAKKMIEAGRQPIVCSDAVGSRTDGDHLSALDEMRHMNIRVTTVETILFELLGDAKDPKFKALSAIVK